MIDETIAYIRAHVSVGDLWGQLAEELCEFAQAALKMQRHCSETNPPAVSIEDCLHSVAEEHADVVGLLKVLDWNDKLERKAIMEYKLNRWASRIAEGRGAVRYDPNRNPEN